MIKSVLTSKYTWISVFALCCLISFAIEAGRTTAHCEWSYEGLDVKGSADCGVYLPDQMCSSAITITRKIEMVWNDVNYTSSVVRRCPWHSYTSVFNYFSIFFSILFTVIFVLDFKLGLYRRIVFLGVPTVIFFMISSIMMGTDIHSGKARIQQMEAKYTDYVLSYEQHAFVANIVFNVFAFFIILFLVLTSYRAHRAAFREFPYGYDFPKKGVNTADPNLEMNGAQM